MDQGLARYEPEYLESELLTRWKSACRRHLLYPTKHHQLSYSHVIILSSELQLRECDKLLDTNILVRTRAKIHIQYHKPDLN